MKWLISLLLWIKGPNFMITQIRHIDHEGFIRPGPGPKQIINYVYNLKKLSYFGNTWPPKFQCRWAPIQRVTRTGEDITDQVLQFAGPRKNEIGPLAFCTFAKKWKVRFRSPFGIQISLEDYVIQGDTCIQVETILNQKFQVEPSKI